MDIQLSKTLKLLRQNANKTQEDLANYLNITSQAVSKWERDEGYPDITLLPRIASFFHVTVDTVLGVDDTTKQIKIDQFTVEYNKIRHHIPMDPNHNLDEGIALVRKALIEVPGDYFLEQLLAADLSQKGRNTNDSTEKTKLLNEAILLCEDILSRSHEDRWRDSAKQILLATYATLGMMDKALEIAYQLSGPRCTREYMLAYILQDQALENCLKKNAVIYYQIFKETVQRLIELGILSNNIIHEREAAVYGIEQGEYLSAIENILSHAK
jgi:transcriptional regulator with XRE-family HTH domain